MKRETTKRQRRPTTAALREMPEIDFSVFRIRRNPYAQRIGHEGIEVAHDGPSQRALAEMPETDFSRVRMRANKYARQAAAAAANIQYGKGRPRRGTEVGPTPTRSLRLPETIWKALEREAQEKATTVHALLRELVVAHVSNLTASPKDAVRNR